MAIQNLENARLAAEVQLLEAEARTLEAKVTGLQSRDVRQLALSGGVDSALVVEAIAALKTYRTIDTGRTEKQPIHISLNMGQVDPRRVQTMVSQYIDLFALIDYIRFMQQDGYKFTVQVTGQAVQQAACLLQVADERIMTPHSRLMFTQEEFAIRVNSAEAKKKLQFHERLEERARQFVCGHSKVDMERLGKETEYNRQWWIDSKIALELGLVDAVDVRLVPGKAWTPKVELFHVEGDTLEVRKLKAAARKDLAEAELLGLEAEMAEAVLRPSPVMFLGPVVQETCTAAALALQKQARTPGAELSMLIYTPGGSVVDGATLLDVIAKLKADGHKFTTTAIGCAASMGGYLLQAGDEREIGEHGLVLIHRISSVIGGGSSQAKDQELMMSNLEQEVLPMLLDRSNITMDEYMKRTEEGDWWIESQEAVDRKVVDRKR